MKVTALWMTSIFLLLSSCNGIAATPEIAESTPERVTPTTDRVTPSPETMGPQELERAKKDVYRVVASQICDGQVVHVYPEVVRYLLYDDEPHARARLPGASAETWENYKLVNDPNLPVTRFSDFPIDCAYEFVSPTDVICAGPETSCIVPWGFSDIGFNQTKTQALVYMYSDCSECGGGGSIYLLEKRDGSWVLINSWVLWVS